MNLLENVTIHTGDALRVLKKLESESVHCVVTSPPYWALRDYGVDGQYGLETDPRKYIRNMVRVFREVRRVLRDDGTVWLNLGDSYANGGRATRDADDKLLKRGMNTRPDDGAKPKDLLGIPWRVAFALQADGWYLRQDIIWHKPNPMPESVRDRCTKAHEYIFLLSKSERYYFDHLAIQEASASDPTAPRNRWDRDTVEVPGQKPMKRTGRSSGNLARVYDVNVMNPHLGRNVPWEGGLRNKRSVWSVPTVAYTEEHFAVFPPKLIEPCVLAGCPVGGVVLDLFGGSGTTGGVAVAHDRKAVLIELNPDYVQLMPARIEQVVRELRQAPAPPPVPKGQVSLFDVQGGGVNVMETKN